MTPPPTTPKRIEKIYLKETWDKLCDIADKNNMSDSGFNDLTNNFSAASVLSLADKINEIIDRLHTIEEERNG